MKISKEQEDFLYEFLSENDFVLQDLNSSRFIQPNGVDKDWSVGTFRDLDQKEYSTLRGAINWINKEDRWR